jgi:hypothetical protein
MRMLNLKKQALKSTTGNFFIRTALCLIGCMLLLSSPSQGCFIVGDLDGDWSAVQQFRIFNLFTGQWIDISPEIFWTQPAFWQGGGSRR